MFDETTSINLRTRKKLSRRDLLALMGKAGIAGTGAVMLGNCKGSPTTPPPPPPPPPPPVRSNVLVRFFNHTQGYLGEKTYSGMSESPLEIKVSDCPDTSTVDSSRIAVRKAANGGWLGSLIELSRTGKLNVARFPREDAAYDAFLMNTTNGADYDLIDNNPSSYHGKLFHSPNSTWWREDIYCFGPDEMPREAMRQIKESLLFPWAKYMDFREVPMDPMAPAGDFFVGYVCPREYPGSSLRGHAHDMGAWVNLNVCQNEGHPLIRVFLEQIFKHITGCTQGEVAPGSMLTYQYITNDVTINVVGKDLLAYVPVKDIQNGP